MDRLRLKDRRRLRNVPEIPTSSMADIAFLLIIFFMLTAVFTSRQGLRFGYPEQDPTNVQPKESVLIKIEGEGRYVVNDEAMSLQVLGSYIQTVRDTNPEKPFIIRPRAEVPYSEMVKVFDLLRRLGVENVSIPTQSEVDAWKAYGYFE
ncbi:MAG TPA: biopolymer transporter ExbD [Acidobacteriota bacterium]|nr:biopolymer transporter ExbD [Acidobacteriota bacterium]